MGGTVVHDPDYAMRRLVGFSAHDFSNQAIDRSNAGFLFAADEHLGPMHVPRRQIGPCTFTAVFAFDSGGTTWRRPLRGTVRDELEPEPGSGKLQWSRMTVYRKLARYQIRRDIDVTPL
jgi:hypothetical protein